MNLRTAVAALLALLAFPAMAHRSSEAFLTMEAEGATVRGHWEIALRDLAVLHPVDADGDSAVTWGELRQAGPGMIADLANALSLTADAEPCALSIGNLLVNDRLDGRFAWFELSAACPQAPRSLEIRYDLLSAIDPGHRGIVVVQFRGGPLHAAVLGGEQPEAAFSSTHPSALRLFGDYLREGVRHIWIGFDHILFLLALLLPSVLRREERQWVAMPGLGSTLWGVAGVVTAFTVAHSVTLSLAALEIVELPTALVESVIAASVLVAAVNNVFPVITARRWAVALLFGLLHGFGFASVLGELGLPEGMRLVALLAFNAGVELGQLAIVLAVVPLLFAARGHRAYRELLLPVLSLGIAAMALYWMVERWPG